jgi:UDP-galactopyranose mutase
MNHISYPTGQQDLICLSHLRWNFVFQRPQHLMSRFARERRVFFIEEPIRGSGASRIQTAVCPQTGVHVVTPHLTPEQGNEVLEQMLSNFLHSNVARPPILWFYTPMALASFPSSIRAEAVVYDCMDELSMFRGAPKELQFFEDRLFGLADLVFTGGVMLGKAKRHLHPSVHAFPSGVDFSHFARARTMPREYAEHDKSEQPRLGYAGVIDERLDLPLLDEVAAKKPEWQFIMIGPTAKICPETLPRRRNIHWLGMKDYKVLPNYFAAWDVGIMPFALNDATRFISPTKTPEYLSAGLPVVSTSIQDVVQPYGQLGLAWIASTADEFVSAAEQGMVTASDPAWRMRADRFLEGLSWDSVWGRMNGLLSQVLIDSDINDDLSDVTSLNIEEQIASV